MPKVVLDFRLGTIYMVNSRISRLKVPNALMISAFVRLDLAYLEVIESECLAFKSQLLNP